MDTVVSVVCFIFIPAVVVAVIVLIAELDLDRVRRRARPEYKVLTPEERSIIAAWKKK